MTDFTDQLPPDLAAIGADLSAAVRRDLQRQQARQPLASRVRSTTTGVLGTARGKVMFGLAVTGTIAVAAGAAIATTNVSPLALIGVSESSVIHPSTTAPNIGVRSASTAEIAAFPALGRKATATDRAADAAPLVIWMLKVQRDVDHPNPSLGRVVLANSKAVLVLVPGKNSVCLAATFVQGDSTSSCSAIATVKDSGFMVGVGISTGPGGSSTQLSVGVLPGHPRSLTVKNHDGKIVKVTLGAGGGFVYRAVHGDHSLTVTEQSGETKPVSPTGGSDAGPRLKPGDEATYALFRDRASSPTELVLQGKRGGTVRILPSAPGLHIEAIANLSAVRGETEVCVLMRSTVAKVGSRTKFSGSCAGPSKTATHQPWVVTAGSVPDRPTMLAGLVPDGIHQLTITLAGQPARVLKVKDNAVVARIHSRLEKVSWIGPSGRRGVIH